MKTLELQEAPGQYRFRILLDGSAMMDWQSGQRSIFDVQINAQKRFGQCDRVRMLNPDGAVEHEWAADKVDEANHVELASAQQLREALEAITEAAKCVNVSLNASDMPMHRANRVFALRNAIAQADKVLSGGAR